MPLSRLPEPSLALEPVLDCLEAIALSISQTQSIDDILNTAVREVYKILQTDRVLICRFQPDGSGVVTNESVSSSWMPVLNQTIDENSFTSNRVDASRSGYFSAIADIYTSDIQPDYLELLAQFQVRANLVVPIVENTPTQKPLWGFLIAHHCSEPRQWQPLEVKLLQQIAVQIAIAIGQTKAFEQLKQKVVERTQVQEALQESEQKFRQMAENIQSVFWMSNFAMSQIDYISPAYEKIWARPCAELYACPKSWLDAVHLEDRDRVIAMLTKIRQDDYEQEYRIMRPDGEIRWIRDRSFPIRDEAGQVYRVVGIAEDISDAYRQAEERKRVEEDLRKSEQQFRQIFQEAPIGISVADFQTHRFLKANPAWCQLLGYSASELLSLTFDEISHPDDLSKDLHNVKQIEQGKIDSFRMEKRYRQKNGEFMWANLTVTVLPSQKGKPKLNLAMIEDITERRQLQTDLLHSEERFRTSVENMLDCFGIYSAIRDHSGQIVDFLIEYVNPATCTFNRTPKEDHIGKRLCELLPSHRETGLFDEYCQLVETGQPLVKESLLFKDTINGQPISGAFDLRAVKLGDGMAVAWRDITERKQAEDQIKASLLEKETLLKEIHHRVKNNLQIISSLLRLQSRQIRDQQTLELFKESQNRVQAMALIHEKLYQSSNLARIDFQEYITSLVGNLCRSYDTRRHDVTFKINVEPVSLAIDTAIPCGLIINELLTNSLKYAFPENQAGEICISLQFGESPLNAPLDRENFILTIRDNGIGLPQDFDFRNTRSLGLQLMCRLTKQIGGSLQHNRSQGTEFKIVFAKPISN